MMEQYLIRVPKKVGEELRKKMNEKEIRGVDVVAGGTCASSQPIYLELITSLCSRQPQFQISHRRGRVTCYIMCDKHIPLSSILLHRLRRAM